MPRAISGSVGNPHRRPVLLFRSWHGWRRIPDFTVAVGRWVSHCGGSGHHSECRVSTASPSPDIPFNGIRGYCEPREYMYLSFDLSDGWQTSFLRGPTSRTGIIHLLQALVGSGVHGLACDGTFNMNHDGSSKAWLYMERIDSVEGAAFLFFWVRCKPSEREGKHYMHGRHPIPNDYLDANNTTPGTGADITCPDSPRRRESILVWSSTKPTLYPNYLFSSIKSRNYDNKVDEANN